MLKKLLVTTLVLTCLGMVLPTSLIAIEEGAAIRGKIAQSKYKGYEIPLEELNTRLIQQVILPEPPLPENWKEMEVKQREEWIKAFQESEKGKKFIANNEKILDEAQVFSLKIEKDGEFVVYDVPPGTYALRGRVDKKIKTRNFAFEVFGEVRVLEDVDEMMLDPIMVLVTPLLTVGEVAPAFQLKTHDNSATLVPKQFRGKYIFLNFWSTESPPSVEFQGEVQKMYEQLKSKYPLELLSINVDEKRKIAIDHIKKSKLRGNHGFTDGWDHRTLDAFGVRAIPSHWLIDPDGKIKMTHMDFRRAFMSGKPDLSTIVDDRIAGRDVPTPTQPAAEEPKKDKAGSQ